VRGDEDDGSGLVWGAELEDLGDTVLERVDDVLVLRVTEEGQGTWWC
jgi:hypothetical protein